MTPVYEFKSAARVPAGVTADGVMAERDKIKQGYGKATVENSVLAVMSEPQNYPNLRAFAPTDPEEALKIVIAEGIRTAYANVIPIRVVPMPANSNGGQQTVREVRVLHAVKDEEGDIVYEPLTVIKQSTSMRAYLLNQIQREIDQFTGKLQDVIEELKAVDSTV